ncbi:MAG: type I DNA topoisomerase [Armatimonadetes bacterium]|nr:type I DNA topoisomerase [Armatimonadota bacterium]
MAKKLVIVESPAKAKTIRQFLGSDYQVEASIGHIRDLPANRKGMPEEHKKKWWADYAVDVDNGFLPFYEVSPEKKHTVENLKKAMKGADELVLATDEDREGESISWHLLEVLKPAKGVSVKRIAFHEITKSAILEALRNPRTIDSQLVEAQEARRVLDRLYGYTLSPVLWSKVAKDLSAGRVQSPAVKLVVERAKQRRDFRTSAYCDLKAGLKAPKGEFAATLKTIEGRKVAGSGDFDPKTGLPASEKHHWLQDAEARSMAEAGKSAKPWTVLDLQSNPGQERPPAPFRTTTLQQDANSKFSFSAERTMRIAQDLYEGVEIGGSLVGLITYMRTDSLHLADSSIRQARAVIEERFGKEHVPAKPNTYASKVANAQEAHEAIRPTDFERSPESIRRDLLKLSEAHFKLYDLIYKRALASQMKPAQVLRSSVDVGVRIDAKDVVFTASGKTITFPGYLLAYVADHDDAEAELEGKEKVLPEMRVGQALDLASLEVLSKATKPPPRYTDASLIKALEELGIGRPSTYASILSVIEDRGYVRREKRELIATWLAFLTMDVLESNFAEFMDLKFTANMDDELDQIANGKEDSKAYLKRFFLGANGFPGLRPAVQERKATIPYPAIPMGADPESGRPIVVKVNQRGKPYLQLGEAEDRKFANIPDDLDPADLTLEKALELLNAGAEQLESVGTHPDSGRNLLLRNRNGFYLEVERTAEEIAAKVKPTWVALPQGVDPKDLSQEDLDELCRLPKALGTNPDTGEEIVFRLGKYGPYIQSGKEIRNVADWREGIAMSVPMAMELLSVSKIQASRNGQSKEPLKVFEGVSGFTAPIKLMAGRFGPYVTDGETNATLPKGTDATTLTAEFAAGLIVKKREAGPAPKRGKFKRFGKKPGKSRR